MLVSFNHDFPLTWRLHFVSLVYLNERGQHSISQINLTKFPFLCWLKKWCDEPQSWTWTQHFGYLLKLISYSWYLIDNILQIYLLIFSFLSWMVSSWSDAMSPSGHLTLQSHTPGNLRDKNRQKGNRNPQKARKVQKYHGKTVISKKHIEYNPQKAHKPQSSKST